MKKEPIPVSNVYLIQTYGFKFLFLEKYDTT